MKPSLFIFSGLPAAGKSTLAGMLVEELSAVYIRIDTIEQALRDLCSFDVQGEGYRLAYRVAADNLRLGIDVVADSCNPWPLTRGEWNSIATDNNADYINIEVICSDRAEHEKRALTRQSEVSGLILPTWKQILERDYQPWTEDRILIDTAGRSSGESFEELMRMVNNERNRFKS
ncbi:MAG: kinase [Candidatus Wallbacteria bacterium HGW-Wallbacteria-1]|uniref:Kinase n=1 Tax=Candidatus Wallbacteria bacterium HGW-Wallbacteria-1 TaxID=2013854 RepID=A0A2N1PI97_9BACT|nr:MAG: kinase [Candidatus Wallbacteria bacterium HGW-Wallbacteria-1]